MRADVAGNKKEILIAEYEYKTNSSSFLLLITLTSLQAQTTDLLNAVHSTSTSSHNVK